MGLIVFIIVVAIVLRIAKSWGYLDMSSPAPPTAAPEPAPPPELSRVKVQIHLSTARRKILSVKERAQLGLPIEYIGDSGQVELLSPGDPWYDVVAEQLLTPRTKNKK